MAQQGEVKVEQRGPPPPKTVEKRGMEQWSSQYSAYTTIVLIDGKPLTVKFVGNKLVLDLDNHVDSKVSEFLHSSTRNHIDFEVISSNAGADIEKQAVTLRKLYDMSEATLARLIGADELKKLGLPANCSNKEKLIVAFLKTKTLG